LSTKEQSIARQKGELNMELKTLRKIEKKILKM